MQKIIIILSVIFLAISIFFLFSKQKQSKNSTKEISPIAKQTETTNLTTAKSDAMKINTNNSTINWNAKKIIGQPNHTGIIKIKSGSLYLDSGKLSGGEIVVDMNTIENNDLQNQAMREKLVSHLKSADFFDVEKFPETTLVITDVHEKAEVKNTHEITGNLTIKGVTNQISFPAKISTSEKMIVADAKFSINRVDWNVRFGSNSFFDNLGDQAIDDMMNFEIHIET